MPFPADLPDPGIEPGSPALQMDSLPAELSGKPSWSVWTGYFVGCFYFDFVWCFLMAVSRPSFRQEHLSTLCVHGARCGQALRRRCLPGFSTETPFPPCCHYFRREFTHKPGFSLLSLSVSLSAYQNFLLTPQNSLQLFCLHLWDIAPWECVSPYFNIKFICTYHLYFWGSHKSCFHLESRGTGRVLL